MLPYNMSWLHHPAVLKPEEVESYYVRYWDSASVKELINIVAGKLNKRVKITTKDRSIFVGRHTDTGFYNSHPQPLRYQVNRLFDRDYEGRVAELKADFSFLDYLQDMYPVALIGVNLRICYITILRIIL
ncbi:MAG: hypothetical protein ACYC6P_03775 [Ignavibacteriaceae bacterium]